MKKIKLEKGITLVALIITIVVLLILAVVSIGAVRNSGIIGHAQNSADMWITGKENEEVDLHLNEEYLDEITGNKKVTIKTYENNYGIVIISSDDKLIFINKNSNTIINNKITHVEGNLIVKDKNKIDEIDISFTGFFECKSENGEAWAIMGLSDNALYNLEQWTDEDGYFYTIQDTFNLNENIDVSEYLKNN